MKKFIQNITVFVLALLVYFGIITVMNFLIIENSELPLPKSSVLIIGDSHPQYSIDPSVFRSANNISQSAEPYPLTFWKLRYITQYQKPDTLILGFSHHNITSFNDHKFSNDISAETMFKRSYLIEDYNSVANLEVDYKKFYSTYLRRMLLFPHNKHFMFIGKYDNSNRSDITDVDSIITRHYYFEDSAPSISNTSVSYLDSIVDFCTKKEIVLYLVGSPVHPDYFKKIPNEIKQRYTAEKLRVESDKVSVYDLTSEVYPDSLYLNSDHLNQLGATRFTNELIGLMRE